jgi:hypothetical protein
MAAVITVPRPLRERLGDDGSDSLVTLLNQFSLSLQEDVITLVGEKFERRLSEEISKLRIEMKEEISKLRVEMAQMRADLIRWMFVFWVGQLIAMLGLLVAILSK